MKTVLGVIVTSVFLVNAFVETPSQTISTAAASSVKRDIKGFALGMTYEEIKALAENKRKELDCRYDLEWVNRTLESDVHEESANVHWFSRKYLFSSGPVATFCDFRFHFTRHIKPSV